MAEARAQYRALWRSFGVGVTAQPGTTLNLACLTFLSDVQSVAAIPLDTVEQLVFDATIYNQWTVELKCSPNSIMSDLVL